VHQLTAKDILGIHRKDGRKQNFENSAEPETTSKPRYLEEEN
jgi:hypothetical protein